MAARQPRPSSIHAHSASVRRRCPTCKAVTPHSTQRLYTPSSREQLVRCGTSYCSTPRLPWPLSRWARHRCSTCWQVRWSAAVAPWTPAKPHESWRPGPVGRELLGYIVVDGIDDQLWVAEAGVVVGAGHPGEAGAGDAGRGCTG